MSPSWAAIVKAANGGKYNGINLNDISRYDKILEAIQAEIDKVAPLAAKARLAKEKKAIEAERKDNPLSALSYPIRLMILDFVIDPITTPLFLTNRRTGHVPKFPVPAIARAFNLQNRLECINVLLSKSNLVMHSDTARSKTMTFLQSTDFNDTKKDTNYNNGYDCVKSLEFPYFSRFPHKELGEVAPNKDIRLMRMSKNLKTVRMVWVDEEATFFADMDGYLAKPIEQIRREYRLDLMLGLKNIRHLHLTSRHTNYIYEESGDIGYRQVCALKAWFDEEFGKQKREHAVNVTVS